jgi:hypothetical protein
MILVIVLIVAVAGVMFMLKEEENSPNPDPSNVVKTSGLVTAQLPSGFERIIINAGDFVSTEGPLEVVADESCAGGKCIYLPDNALGKPAKLDAKLTYKFSVKKAGTYKLWIRHWWQDDCANSLFVVVDNGPQMLFGDDGTVNVWRWPPTLKMTLDLTEGEHTLTIIPREDGMKFDQILITADPDEYPVSVLTK